MYSSHLTSSNTHNQIQTDGQTKIKLMVRRFISALDDDDPHSYSDEAVPVTISTLDLSIDMLKREILKDPFAIKRLGVSSQESSVSLHDAILGTTSRYFTVGLIDEMGSFRPFDYTSSLKYLGIKPNSTIWINFRPRR